MNGTRSSGWRDLAAVCCHFNPCHYASRLRNYWQFREAIARSGIPLLTVELAFADEAFEIPADRDVLHIRGGDIMWQKERLLQIGAERLVDQGCRALALLDADVIFERSDWPAVVSAALERHRVVQCFTEALTQYSDQVLVEISGIKHYLETGSLSGRAGYAWAMQADVFSAVGLYQHCVVGGGDSMLFLGAIGLASVDSAWNGRLAPHDFIKVTGPAMLSHYRAWADRFLAAVGDEVGYADLKITTLAHGARRDRHYSARHRLLDGFDPTQEVAYKAGGALEWAPCGHRRREPVAGYFWARNEDGARRNIPMTQRRRSDAAAGSDPTRVLSPVEGGSGP
jgi:hypothetical protein